MAARHRVSPAKAAAAYDSSIAKMHARHARERRNAALAQGAPREKSSQPAATSAYIGVGWVARDDKWRARIRDVDGVTRTLGTYADEVDAALAYDRFAYIRWGDEAKLNFGVPTAGSDE